MIRTLNIAGVKYKVVYCALDGAWGETDDDARIIRINKELRENPQELKATLLHEAAHAMLHVSGIRYSLLHEDAELEESLVRAIENLYLPIVSRIEKVFS